MIVIRLALAGSKKRPFYHLVVANSRSPRDGAFLERLGFFNPLTDLNELRLKLNIERIDYWRKNGAQMTDRVKSLLREHRRINAVTR